MHIMLYMVSVYRVGAYEIYFYINHNKPDRGATSSRALTYLGLSLNFSATGKYSTQKQFT